MMSANEMPTEILQNIFRHLTGFAAIQCRAVCTRWRDAIDTLSDAQWKQICFNELLGKNYAELRARHGLSWYDTYRAYHYWSQIGSAELTIQKLCDNAEFFIVRPHGIVCYFNKTKESDDNYDRICDTVVYYDTNTGEECARQQVDFYFWPRLFAENEHLQVFVLKDCRICVLVKETKQKNFVGSLNNIYNDTLFGMTLIGKSVYFRNSVDQGIYQSKLNDDNTVATKKLGAVLKERKRDTIITFIERNGNLYFLKCYNDMCSYHVYKYNEEHEKFKCLWESVDDEDLFVDLKNVGFDWRSREICAWIKRGKAFYADDMIILSPINKGKAINIHRFFNFIRDSSGLNGYVRRTSLRKLELGNNMIPCIEGNDSLKFDQVDIIVTPNSLKILAIMSKVLFVFDLKRSGNNKNDESDQKIIKKPRLTKT